MSNSGFGATILHSSSSPAVRTGLNQQNKIALVASGSTITVYINEQYVDQVQDSSYTSGRLGLIADTQYGNATDVAYTNARLWTL